MEFSPRKKWVATARALLAGLLVEKANNTDERLFSHNDDDLRNIKAKSRSFTPTYLDCHSIIAFFHSSFKMNISCRGFAFSFSFGNVSFYERRGDSFRPFSQRTYINGSRSWKINFLTLLPPLLLKESRNFYDVFIHRYSHHDRSIASRVKPRRSITLHLLYH